MTRERAEELKGERNEEGKKAEERLICWLNLSIMSGSCRDSHNPTQLPISRKAAGLSPVLGAFLDQKNNDLVYEDERAAGFHVVALTAKYLLLQKSLI